jgi:hypothetical protein
MFNIVFVVVCKFDIFNAEYVDDKLFKFVIVELRVEFIIFQVNNDVDVVCKFDILNDEYVDKLFKLLLVPLIFKKL